MDNTEVRMPDGRPFEFWDDVTRYRRVYHVACLHPHAADDGPGTAERPFATIGRAAQMLEPGEKVCVHGGVYRECVRPARGGASPEGMIAYEAAGGETVTVRGSERWAPVFTPSGEWRFGSLPKGRNVWTAPLPAEWFRGYNPFATSNFSSEFTTFTRDWSTEEIQRFMLRRGMVFADGRPLRQVFRPEELGAAEGTFWVEDPGLRLHLRLWNDAPPAGVAFEVTAREQVFAPAEPGLGFIRVSGFLFEYAADGVPVPQRALVSASRGHHWIVENNHIRWANACGLDVGNETWHRPRNAADGVAGRHIIRRNHVSDCGVCGMAAISNNTGSLVEDNVIERIGGMNIERIWETGGLKFHVCDSVLIRRNVFRHIRHAPGLWLDYMNRNCRVTRNVFADIEGIHGAVYLEVSQHPNVIDHNIIWDVRGFGKDSAHGVDIDSGEMSVVAHNLIGRVQGGCAIAAHLNQSGRLVEGRTGLGRRHQIMNNLIVQCLRHILFSRADENRADANLYETGAAPTAFCVQFPAPAAILNLDAWRSYYGFDLHSQQATIRADFDADTLALTLAIEGEVAVVPAMAELGEGTAPATPGALTLAAGANASWRLPLAPEPGLFPDGLTIQARQPATEEV